jgi:hypothetical protein
LKLLFPLLTRKADGFRTRVALNPSLIIDGGVESLDSNVLVLVLAI